MNKSFLNQPSFYSPAFVYSGLLLLTLVGYWPVTTLLFAVKNDDIVYFLPLRYNIVEIIRNGDFPLWSPYVYLGLPIAGDIQSGAWNPLVWLLSLTGRYTLTTLHVELLICLYLGGIGMFKLMAECRFKPIVCWTIASAYLFSGFVLDSGQIFCWITCAGFLPFTHLYFLRLLRAPTPSGAVKLALSNVLLLVAGYPFFFIANTYFLALASLAFFIYSVRKNGLTSSLRIPTYIFLTILLFALVSAAPLLSFMDLLPHYGRGQGLGLSRALDQSYALFSSISLVFPFSITRPHHAFYGNGEIARNMYMGVLLIPFVILATFQKKQNWWILVLAFTLLSFAMSLGQVLPLRKWAYWYLPLMDNFRHPANFRLFVITGLLSLAGKGLQEFVDVPAESRRKYLLYAFAGLLAVMLGLALYYFPAPSARPVSDIAQHPGGLKAAFEGLSFSEAVSISALIQVPFVFLAIYFVRKGDIYRLCLASVLNVVLVSMPQQFYSMVGRNPVSGIDPYLKEQPAGFPIPDLSRPVLFPGNEKTFFNGYPESLKTLFNKQVAVSTFLNNPTVLHGYGRLIDDSLLMAKLAGSPFIFFADSVIYARGGEQRSGIALADTSESRPDARLSIVVFEPSTITLRVNRDRPGTLVIFQNHLPGWEGYIDNNSVTLQTVNHTLMAINVPAGSHEIRLRYTPWWFLPGMITSGTGLLICFVLLVIRRARKERPLNDS